jgi:DNA-binding XRE family transcriptional regulator
LLKLPERTYYNKRIPKNKFYEKLKVKSKLEKQFSTEIESVYWKNKLAPDTLNISAGKNVQEIEIFEINLRQQGISTSIIETIDREIPYHILFVLRYQNLAQLWISYKESSKNREGKFKVDSYYCTDWLKAEELTLSVEGLTLDKVYENFILQIAGEKLKLAEEKTLKEAVNEATENEKLQKQIQQLENKIAREKQFNRQVRLMGELRALKSQLENS